MTEEIWADISGYEGKYLVSNLGRVKSMNYNHTGKEKIMKTTNSGTGYLIVNLCVNGKCKNFLVHRLVAEAFIPNQDNLSEVNHKDENKLNNCAKNLEWCSAKYNCCYGTRNRRISKALAKKIGCYKDKQLIKIYNSIRDTDKDGFYYQNVWKCCRGKLKSSGGFTWRYLDD